MRRDGANMNRGTTARLSAVATRAITACLAVAGLALAQVHAADLSAPTAASAIPRDKVKFHLFLLAGQSNMAGRGKVDPTNNVVHPRVWMLNRESRWVPAKEPIHFDKPSVAGAGLSFTFAKVLAERNPDLHIGLIPCAMGGSPIDAWAPGQKLFKDAAQRVQKAKETGTLRAILWHQGESDTAQGLSATYGEKLRKLIAAFREELQAPEAPFIAGELGRWNSGAEGVKVNADLNALTSSVTHYACVSSEGLRQKPDDQLHFEAESLREFGRRYAAAYLKVVEAKK